MLLYLFLMSLIGLAASNTKNPFITAAAGIVPLALMGNFARGRYYLRLGAYVSLLAINSFCGVFLAVFMAVLNQRSNIFYFIARGFYFTASPFIGMKLDVEGEQYLNLDSPAILLGNHQTMIDILYLGRIFPKRCTIMAKKEIKYMPFLGWFMSLARAVFINRSKRVSAVALMNQVGEEMAAKNLSLFIFPEGTRSNSATPTLLPFKKGPFHLAASSGFPIIPIVCENYSASYSSKEKRFESGRYVVKVLEPISVEAIRKSIKSSGEEADKMVVDGLLEVTRDRMLEALQDISKSNGKQGDTERTPLTSTEH